MGFVFSGDLSDEACSDIGLSSGELAKSEAAIQDSLARRARSWHKKRISTEGALQGGSEHGFCNDIENLVNRWNRAIRIPYCHALSALIAGSATAEQRN